MGSYGRKLGEILVEDYRVLEGDIEQALASQKYVPDRLGALMVRMGVLSGRDLVTALGQQLGCPVVLELPRLEIGEDLLQLVPIRTAEKKLVVPIAISGKSTARCLILAMADPTDRATVDAVERMSGFDVLPAIAPEEDVRRALKVFYFSAPQRDMVEVSESFELIRAQMHERTGAGNSAPSHPRNQSTRQHESPVGAVPADPSEHQSTAA
jgi:type IV pilus assembly protein PilB